jgi:O-acetylhomoserine/O-acetylserine sulfhydrylase
MGIFKNPIILLSLVSMGLFFGMPKLVENSEYNPFYCLW